ncbi:hypothetical protein Tco_1409761 [Tanacetum coccineum]
MDTTKAQQKALDDALVAPENRLMIRKCNQRLSSTLKSNEPTIQVALDALKLTPFYNAFEVSTDVLEIYMQEFWAAVTKHHFPLWFKLNGKNHTVNVDNFRDMLKICPKLPGQKFKEPPFEEEIPPLIRYLGHTGDIKDFMFQVENKDSKKNNDMFYLRFTKVIVDYFMAKDPSISRRNKMFWHTARDDSMFTTIRVISKHQDTQIYGANLPHQLTNQAMLESEAYKTYHAYANGEKTLKPKKKKADSESSPKEKPAQALKGKRLKTLSKAAQSTKEKQPAIKSKAKGLTVLSEVTLTEDEQMKLATKRSRIQTHNSHLSGSDEGAGDKLEVLDVPDYKSDSKEESWTFSDGDDVNEESDAHDASDENESDDEGNDFVHPNLSTYTPDDQDEEEKVEDEEKAEDDEDKSNQRVHTPPNYQLSGESEKQKYDDVEGREDYGDEEMLYGDLNLNRERIDARMTEAHATKDTEDANVNLTDVTPVVQQQSSSTPDLVPKFINPSTDEGIDSVLNQNIQSDTLVDIPITNATETPSSYTTTLQLSTLNIHSLQTPVTLTSTTFPTTTLPEIPNFASLFGFDQRVTALESELSILKQSNPFVESVSSIPGIVDKYLATKMKEAVDVAVQLKSDKLREEAQAENQDFINSLDSNKTKIIKQQVKAQTSKIMSKLKKYVTDTLGAEVLVRSTNQPQTSYAIASLLLELELKKIFIYKMEENKSIDRSEFNTGDDDVTPVREAQDEHQWHPSSSPTLDRE